MRVPSLELLAWIISRFRDNPSPVNNEEAAALCARYLQFITKANRDKDSPEAAWFRRAQALLPKMAHELLREAYQAGYGAGEQGLPQSASIRLPLIVYSGMSRDLSPAISGMLKVRTTVRASSCGEMPSLG